MSNASDLEQAMVELVNAERASAGAQPLAFDRDLNESAEDHSSWMLGADQFSHTGAGGSSPGDRMAAAGYVFTGSWTWGENIAWQSTRGDPGYGDDTAMLHQSLMNSAGHRANILNGAFREIGVGIEIGDFDGWNAAMVTQNFAKTGSDYFLTGVAFDDRDNDDFYDAGEGLANVNVVVVDGGGHAVQTVTTASGGYQVALAAGTYSVTFDSPGLRSGTRQVTIDGRNVKLDYVDPAADTGPTTGTSGNDTLIGTAAPDILSGLGGRDTLRGLSGNDRLDGGSGDDLLDGGNGNDSLLGGDGSDRLYGAASGVSRGADYLDGGAGADLIYADASDVVRAGSGLDKLVIRPGGGGMSVLLDNAHADVEDVYGGPDDDILDGSAVGAERLTLRGSGGDDLITGGAAADRIYGGDDDDILRGRGGDDYLKGEAGSDTMLGGSGDDRLRGGDGADTLDGGRGGDVLTGGGGADLFINSGGDGLFDRVVDYRATQQDAILNGASYKFSGVNTYVYDAAGNPLMRLDGYDAGTDGILYA